jgi:hypothetical protein
LKGKSKFRSEAECAHHQGALTYNRIFGIVALKTASSYLQVLLQETRRGKYGTVMEGAGAPKKPFFRGSVSRYVPVKASYSVYWRFPETVPPIIKNGDGR